MEIFKISQKQKGNHRLFALLLISSFMALSTAYAKSPPAATLTSPSGSVASSSPAYTWNAVSNASWYYLWVDDSSGNVITQWYKASEVGCVSGSGTCSVTSGTSLNQGAGQWWIQTWNADGYGPWSSGMSFDITTRLSAAKLLSPQGNIGSSTPEYSWEAVGGASWYYLWVNDSSGNVIKQWYRASEVGCGSGSGTCSVTHATALNQGAGQWWVQTWNASAGYGPWSSAMLFNLGGGNHINSISASDDGVNLHLKMTGNFTEGSHFGFYIDADNNPDTGYNGGVNEITGTDYLVESGIFYHYPEGAHGWKWKRVSTDSTMENSSTEAQAHIPLRLLNAGSTITYLGSVASSDWSQKAYSQMTEYQLGALGKTLHVDGQGGSDSSDGSAQHPLKTIQAALDRIKPGERIFIKKGLYHEALDIPVSGTQGKPVIIEGEKDANGNRLARVHGGERITVNWQRADEIGNGVYKTTELPNTFAMTLFQDGVFKDIPRLHAMNGKDREMNIQDRKWLEGKKEATGINYTYKDIMKLPDNARFKAYYTQLEVNYWDGIEAVYTYDNGTTYLRFRGGDDPNGLQLYRAGGDTNKNGNLRESLLNDVLQEGATFKLHNRSYITIRGLNIDGAQNGVLIYGNNAHHNVIEDNDIVNGQRRVFIAQLAHDNVVRNNKLHMELLSHYRPGAWYQAQHLPDSQKRYQYAVAEHYYDTYKREIGRSTYSPLDDCGVFVNTAGGGNDIYSNEIYDTLGGVVGGQIGDIKIHDNTFHHISSVSTGLGDGPTYIYRNRFYNVHFGFRTQLVVQEKTDLRAWFFENIMYNPDRLSSGFYLSVNSNPMPQTEDEFATIYIYHNTFVNTGRDNQDIPGNVAKNIFLINNLFDKSFLFVKGGEIGHVDYNWFSDADIFSVDDSPHPYGKHNIESSQDEPWQLPETFPNRMLDFSLPAGSSAVNAGLDLSRPFVLDGVTHDALYGMSEGYFSGAGPNMGAVQ